MGYSRRAAGGLGSENPRCLEKALCVLQPRTAEKYVEIECSLQFVEKISIFLYSIVVRNFSFRYISIVIFSFLVFLT